MKTVRRSGRSEQPYFNDTDIDRIAVEELLGADLLPSKPEPIRIERFVEKRFGLARVYYEELPATILGYTQFSRKGVEAVFVSRALSEEGSRVAERRINSTLAHEAGHGLLHAYLFMLDSFPTGLFENDKDVTPARILCRDNLAVPKRPVYDGRWWEYQANRMIGALLLPKPLALAAIGPHLVPTGHLGTPILPDSCRGKAVRDLAELFDVNTPVAEIRLATLCPAQSVDQLTL
jgi:hypothetical protein